MSPSTDLADDQLRGVGLGQFFGVASLFSAQCLHHRSQVSLNAFYTVSTTIKYLVMSFGDCLRASSMELRLTVSTVCQSVKSLSICFKSLTKFVTPSSEVRIRAFALNKCRNYEGAYLLSLSVFVYQNKSAG